MTPQRMHDLALALGEAKNRQKMEGALRLGAQSGISIDGMWKVGFGVPPEFAEA